jgi:hypothetical protein
VKTYARAITAVKTETITSWNGNSGIPPLLLEVVAIDVMDEGVEVDGAVDEVEVDELDVVVVLTMVVVVLLLVPEVVVLVELE